MSVIALHLLFTGYGHWLPNDPRGSGSRDLRNDVLEPLGPIHHGRKRTQPPRNTLKSFYKDAVPLLQHDPLWFDADTRSAIGAALAQTVASHRYTCWACAIMTNHLHLCIRRHRDTDDVIWGHIAAESAAVVRQGKNVPTDHRVWADRPYAVFLETPADVWRVIRYIEGNPQKEGLPAQVWPFVTRYNNWPFHKQDYAAKRQAPDGAH
jgi:REP element-mobilizing transposase RayT